MTRGVLDRGTMGPQWIADELARARGQTLPRPQDHVSPETMEAFGADDRGWRMLGLVLLIAIAAGIGLLIWFACRVFG